MDPVEHDDEVLPFEPVDPDDEVIPATRSSKLKHAGRQVVYGANRTIFSPVQAITPEFADKYIKPTMYPEDPEGMVGRVADAGGSMIPTALTTGAGLTAAGLRYLPKLTQLPEVLRTHLLRQLTTPWGTSAARMGSDAAMASTGGAGEQLYDEKSENPTSTGKFISGLAGASAVPTLTGGLSTYAQYLSPTTWLARAGKLLGRAATHAFMPDDARERLASQFPSLKPILDTADQRAREKIIPKVADQFRELDHPDYRQAMEDADSLRREIKDFNPTMAESTGLPSAVAAQRDIEANASGANLDKLQRRRLGSEEAVDRYAAENQPKGVPEQIEQGVDQGIGKTRAQLDAEASGLDQRAQGLANVPSVDPAATGKALRDRFYELKNAKSQEMQQLADDLIPPEALFVPFSKLKNRLNDIIKPNAAKPSDFGSTTADILNYDPAVQGKATFGDVKFWREKLGDEIEDALRTGKWSESRRLISVKNELDDFLENDWAKSVPGLADKYKQFRQTYKTDYIDRFEKDASRDMKLRDRDNTFKTEDEKVAKLYWSPGDVTSARQFKETFGDDPKAYEALRGAVMDDFIKKVVPADSLEIHPGRYAQWMRANQWNLNEFPELRDSLSNISTHLDDIAARRASVVGRQKDLDSDLLTKALGKGADNIVNVALNDPATAKRVRSMLSDEQAQAMGRAMWDKVMAAKNPTEARAFMNANQDVLGQFMTKEQMDSLRNTTKALEMMSRTPVPKGKASEADPFKDISESFGTGPLQASSRGLALASGRTGWKYTTLDFLARAFVGVSRKDAEKVMTQAIYDPIFAKELSSYLSSGDFSRKRVSPGLKSYVTALGLNAVGGKRNDDGQQRLEASLPE